MAVVLALAAPLQARDFGQAQKLFLSGAYDECIAACESGIDANSRDEEWHLLHARALLARGRYVEAEEAIARGIERVTGSIRLRVLGFHTAHASGNSYRADGRLRAINQLAMARRGAYEDPANTVALGRAGLLMGGGCQAGAGTSF